ncbi:MAG: magnesium and cobalt transport protein CorA [Lysobacterales bacterium]
MKVDVEYTPSTSMVVNCVAYRSDGTRLPEITIDQISDVLGDADGFVWVGLHEPSEVLLERFQEEFGLHDLAIEDAQHAHQRPKIEVYGDTLFIVLHTAQFVAGQVQFGETHIFLGHRFLLTVRHGASLSYTPARQRCEKEPELLAMGPSYALYAVVDFIVDNFFPIVSEFQSDLTELEAEIFDPDYERDTIKRLYNLKRELVKLRLAVAPMQDILNQLVRFHPTFVIEEVRPYFRDIFDHAVRVKEASDTLSEMLSAAMSVNLAMVTVGQGEVVKRLAGWAGLVAIPTLMTSWYGMNFEHMPELAGRYSYAVFGGITAVTVLAAFVLLKRVKWL